MQNPKFFVCGVNGCGKSDISVAAVKACPEIVRVPGTKALLNRLALSGYNELRDYPQDKALEAWGWVLEQVVAAPRPVIVDSHLYNLVDGKRRDVFHPAIFGFDVLVLVKITAAAVFHRCQRVRLNESRIFPSDFSAHERFSRYETYVSEYEERFLQVAREFKEKNSHREVRALMIDNTKQTLEESAAELIRCYSWIT